MEIKIGLVSYRYILGEYTTNSIENFNHQLWKAPKNRTILPTDNVLFKLLYLAMMGYHEK